MQNKEAAAVDGDEASRRIRSQLAMNMREQRWERAVWAVVLHATETDLVCLCRRRKSTALGLTVAQFTNGHFTNSMCNEIGMFGLWRAVACCTI